MYMIVTQGEIYSQLVQGFSASEIKLKYNLTDSDWVRITNKLEFADLLSSPQSKSELIKIKEIENDLFDLLEVKNPSKGVQRRINSLQVRYSQFLIR